MAGFFQQYLDRQFPHGLVCTPNPLFELERKRLPGLYRLEDIKRYTTRSVLIPAMLSMFGCFCMQSSMGAGLISIVLIFLTVGILIGTDMYYTMLTMRTISRYQLNGQWDILKITPLTKQQIFVAVYAISQIHAWRMMIIEVAIRLFGALVVFLGVLTSLATSLSRSGFRGIDLVELLIIFLALIVLGIVYVVEPLWRMRTLVAVGLAISARIRSVTLAAVAGFGSTLTLHITQVVLLVGLTIIFSRIVTSGASGSVYYDSSMVQPMLLVMSFIAVSAALLFVLYKVVQFLSIQDTLHSAFRPE